MKENLAVFLDRVRLVEGAFVNREDDPGHATCWGVTQATLSSWRKRECTVEDVKALTWEEACPILSSRYWTPVQGDRLPPGIDLFVADFAVHSGPAQAAKILQRCLGVKVDGHVGEKTLAAARAANQAGLLNDLVAARRSFLQALPTWATFGRGWDNRVKLIADAALELQVQQPAPEPIPQAKSAINIQAATAMAGAVIAAVPAARDAYEQSLTAVAPLAALAVWVPPAIGLVVAALTLFMLVRRGHRLADQQ